MPTRSSVRSRLSLGQYSITGTEPLRNRIEIAASAVSSAQCRQPSQLRRDELDALRKDAENLRASIIDALAVPVGTKDDRSYTRCR